MTVPKDCECDSMAFDRWWQNYDSALELNFDLLENLYGTPLIAKLSHVFAAGYFERHGILTGCFDAYVEAQNENRDLFQPYAFTSGRYFRTMRDIFLLGMQAKK